MDEVDEFKWGVGEGDNYVLKSVFLTLYTSESDVCRRQILTYKDDPRTERNELIIMVV